ncbi:aminopeptidase P family protein [Longispora albida]|uniref:aminopeptidase P family protein n=1 Tax=Longispora albida TaxID=203523 RepID=UPI000371D9B6|nr:aminopeptidase P family protein [Longispora albida]
MTEDRPAEGERPHDPHFPEKFLEFMRGGWADSPLDVLTLPQSVNYARRRDQLSAAFPGENLVIPTGGEKTRANDTTYPFRPGTDFFWLTGEHDPESVLILRATASGHESVLYVRPRSPKDTDAFFRNAMHGELWVGRRHTLAEKTAELGVETADLSGLEAALADLAPGRTRVLRTFDEAVDKAILPVGDGSRDTELAKVLSELRLPKDEWEIAQLQDACDITVRGFEDVARILPADRSVSERLLEGIFALRARHDGNDLGYGSIVGNGPHATILHWTRNNGQTNPGDLILMDMGAENHNLYTADVTRTLPVNGRFSPLQRQVYDVVYASQQAGIDVIKPGVEWTEIKNTCNRVLAEGLYDLGVLPGTVEEALDPEAQYFRRWTLHGFGHMLGLDVHDCANASKENYHEGKLDTGYVLTVEPGLYFQAEDELVPAELRGVGIRIEDDILVTDSGSVNLSGGLPRTSAEVETWLGEQREAGPRLP